MPYRVPSTALSASPNERFCAYLKFGTGQIQYPRLFPSLGGHLVASVPRSGSEDFALTGSTLRSGTNPLISLSVAGSLCYRLTRDTKGLAL
jgi:hypothetical protein